MQQNYQDAMSVVRKFGKPDLFVTFTCSPHWNKILESLLFGQKPQDRPDIIARVFQQKLKSLVEDIKKNHIFGVPVAFVYVIEFLKRGLPHAHILIILR
jgi:ATP-dependent DNA helicase PIF1